MIVLFLKLTIKYRDNLYYKYDGKVAKKMPAFH